MPEFPLVDPVSVLAQAKPGQAIYARNQLDAGIWEVSWLIREESARIARLHNPDIEFRAGALEQGVHGQKVLVMPILVRIGPARQENMFETYLNVYQDDGGMIYLHDLARQERLVLHFYGDRMARERSLVVSNQMKSFAQDTLTIIDGYPPWTMHAFDQARAQLYRRYSSISVLWSALQPEDKR